MKLLHVAETAKGGVGTYLDELMPLQAAQLGADKVRALVPSQHRAQLPSVSEDQLFQFDRVDRSVQSLLGLWKQMRRALAAYEPDVLHLHSTFAGLMGRLMFDRAPEKTFYNPHGWAFEMWRKGPKRSAAIAAERLLATRCNRIIAVSEAERRQAIGAGLPDRQVTVVLTGIADLVETRAASWPDQRLKVLFVGRLDRQKGFDMLAAVARRHTTEISLKVIGGPVVGNPPPDTCGSNIEHLGWLPRSEIDAHLRSCDLLAMPSRWEALGLSALEAMRSSKPAIAFDVGGLRDVIEDGVSGRLVPAGDISSFEQALLSATSRDWKRMGVAARRRFEERFTSDRMAEELMRIYSES